jgi:hypothetical protein
VPTDCGTVDLELAFVDGLRGPGVPVRNSFSFQGGTRTDDIILGTHTVFITCAGDLPADANGDGRIDLFDGIKILLQLFLGDAPTCTQDFESDANITLLDADGDGQISLNDGIHVLRHVVRGTEPPLAGTECIVIPECPNVCE